MHSLLLPHNPLFPHILDVAPYNRDCHGDDTKTNDAEKHEKYNSCMRNWVEITEPDGGQCNH
jgi:hypothetical protein